MPDEDHCNEIDTKLAEIEVRHREAFKDIHNHVRELRGDLGDFIFEQRDATLSNTKAINKLTESTETLVNAIIAGRTISTFFRWALPILAGIAAIVTYIKTGTPPN